MELYEIAIKNSGLIWSTLKEAKKLSYQIGEESITDFLVFNIKKWGKGKIIINTFTCHKESMNGSDWKWWFTGKSVKQLGMRIQAKVLNLNSEKYEHLHHINKNRHQVDLLIKDAKKHDLIPLYCMYTNWKAVIIKLIGSVKPTNPASFIMAQHSLIPLKLNNSSKIDQII